MCLTTREGFFSTRTDMETEIDDGVKSRFEEFSEQTGTQSIIRGRQKRLNKVIRERESSHFNVKVPVVTEGTIF